MQRMFIKEFEPYSSSTTTVIIMNLWILADCYPVIYVPNFNRMNWENCQFLCLLSF